jgi:cell division protein FtsQ
MMRLGLPKSSAPRTARPKPRPKAQSRRAWRLRRRAARRAAIVSLALGVVAATGWVLASGLPARAVEAAVTASDGLMVAAGLTVHNVELSGRREAAQADIVAALGLSADTPILHVDLAKARARLESLGWVGAAHVTRRLPSTIAVRLAEREPFALWQRGGRIAVIDRDGEIITRDGLTRFTDLPLVVGEGAAAAAAALIDLIRTAPDMSGHVEAAIRVGDRRWTLRLDSGTDIYLPEFGEADAWRRLVALEREDQILSRDITIIDLRAGDRAVIRLPPEIAARLRDPGERT